MLRLVRGTRPGLFWPFRKQSAVPSQKIACEAASHFLKQPFINSSHFPVIVGMGPFTEGFSNSYVLVKKGLSSC